MSMGEEWKRETDLYVDNAKREMNKLRNLDREVGNLKKKLIFEQQKGMLSGYTGLSQNYGSTLLELMELDSEFRQCANRVATCLTAAVAMIYSQLNDKSSLQAMGARSNLISIQLLLSNPLAKHIPTDALMAAVCQAEISVLNKPEMSFSFPIRRVLRSIRQKLSGATI